MMTKKQYREWQRREKVKLERIVRAFKEGGGNANSNKAPRKRAFELFRR